MRKSTKIVAFWAFLLILYRFFNDLFLHEWTIVECIYEIMKQSLPVLLLISIEYLQINNKKIIKAIFAASFVQILFGIAQLFDYKITIFNYLTHFPFLSAPESTESYMIRSQRICGTEAISIGFALFLGIFIIIAIAAYFRSRKTKYILYIIVCSILILYTQTRSAIYGIVPSILIAYFFSNRSSFKRILSYSLVVLLLFIGFNTIEKSILKFSPRSKFEIGPNTYTKLSATIYGSYATLKVSPLVGMPRSKHYSMIRLGAEELGEIINTKVKYGLTETYHNIIGFYIKNYGLIGIFLFSALIFHIYKKIIFKLDSRTKFMLLGVFIYFIQYAMLHNNALMYSNFLWILLAIGDERNNLTV